MKWFQHSTDSHDDPDISDAEDMFGDAGYTVFFKMLEIYGREFNHLVDGKLTISQTFLRRKLRKRWTKVEQILNFYQTKGRIFLETNGSEVSIFIPKFIDIASNWSKRPKRKKSNYLCRPSVVPTAKETETEKEKEESFTNVKQAKLVSKEKKSGHYSDLIADSLVEDIDAVCKKIKRKNFNPYQFVQKAVNSHPKAILYVLEQIAKDRQGVIKTPWAYANKILQVQNGNFNERDTVQAHEKFKKEWAKFIEEANL